MQMLTPADLFTQTHYNLRFYAILKLFLKTHSHDVRLTHVGAAADRCGALKYKFFYYCGTATV